MLQTNETPALEHPIAFKHRTQGSHCMLCISNQMPARVEAETSQAIQALTVVTQDVAADKDAAHKSICVIHGRRIETLHSAIAESDVRTFTPCGAQVTSILHPRLLHNALYVQSYYCVLCPYLLPTSRGLVLWLETTCLSLVGSWIPSASQQSTCLTPV